MNKNVIYGYDIYDPRVPCPCSHLKLPACSCVFLFPTVFFIGKCCKGCPRAHRPPYRTASSGGRVLGIANWHTPRFFLVVVE